MRILMKDRAKKRDTRFGAEMLNLQSSFHTTILVLRAG